MDKREKMAASLEKNLPVVEKAKPAKIDKDIKDDYDFSRKTYKDLIYNGTRSMDVLSELAIESEHPRAYEVAAGLIKNLSELNKDLLEIQKRRKDLNPQEAASVKNVNVDKAVFVGSTAELVKLLKTSK